MKITATLSAAVLALAATAADAQIRITEWAYSSSSGEYVELTNVGASPIDLTGYSYDDDSRLPGEFSLAGFGTVAPGESVIFTEAVSVEDFRALWLLPASVKVLGGVTNNLGRNDEINIYDASSMLVDRLTFGDQNIAGSIRTQNISGNPSSLAVLGTNNVLGWVLSSVPDAYGSYNSLADEIGNPGRFALVPEPAAAVLALLAMAPAVSRRR